MPIEMAVGFILTAISNEIKFCIEIVFKIFAVVSVRQIVQMFVTTEYQRKGLRVFLFAHYLLKI